MDHTHIAVNGIHLHAATAGPAHAPLNVLANGTCALGTALGAEQFALAGAREGALLCDVLAQPGAAA